tara:strand:+ start:243 stop:1280 length:1038 start_codon:yes stop_codon:yes gene_type:complete
MSYKIFTASDFIHELKNNLPQVKHSLQLFITEHDFYAISDQILDCLSNNITLDIVISSLNNKKSLRLVNLFNRIVQFGGSVYWKVDHNLYQNGVHFMIIDKTFIINKTDYYSGQSDEEKVKHLNSLFDGFRLDSSEIHLLTGPIAIKLEVNNTFVDKGQYVTISWNVENAHEISLLGIKDNLEKKGTTDLLIKEDIVIELEARNREHKVSKQVIIKVVKEPVVDFSVEALDPFLEEYILLRGVGLNHEEYYAFYDQRIKLSWNVSGLGNFSEATLGELPLVGEHVSKLSQLILFEFLFDSIYGSIKKRIILKPVEDETKKAEINKPINKVTRLAKIFSNFKKILN